MKKGISIFLTIIIVCFMGINSIQVSAKEIRNDSKEECEMRVNKQRWYEWAWKVLQYVGGKVNWDSKTPSYKAGVNMDQCSSGAHTFNNGSNAGKLKHDITVRKISNDEIDCFVENSNPLNWGKKALIAYYNPSGKELGNKSVTHEQHYYLNPSGSGNFTAEFSTANNDTWNCYIHYWHYDGENGKSLLTSNNDSELEFYRIGERVYRIPSDSYKRECVSREYENPKEVISLNELLEQMYDEKTGHYVKQYKDYNVGECIGIEEKIKDIYYNSTLNITYFVFDTVEGECEWGFEGDLTKEFEKEQIIKFRFEVVEEYKDEHIVVENLNYILEGTKQIEDGRTPNIKEYIWVE